MNVGLWLNFNKINFINMLILNVQVLIEYLKSGSAFMFNVRQCSHCKP